MIIANLRNEDVAILGDCLLSQHASVLFHYAKGSKKISDYNNLNIHEPHTGGKSCFHMNESGHSVAVVFLETIKMTNLREVRDTMTVIVYLTRAK